MSPQSIVVHCPKCGEACRVEVQVQRISLIGDTYFDLVFKEGRVMHTCQEDQ